MAENLGELILFQSLDGATHYSLTAAEKAGYISIKQGFFKPLPDLFHQNPRCVAFHLRGLDKKGRVLFDHQFTRPGEVTPLLTLSSGFNRVELFPVENGGTRGDDPAEGFAIYYKSWQRDWAETIVIAFILANFIRTFLVQAYYIPSSSMESNLFPNDRIVVNKFVYGVNFKLPFGWFQGRVPLTDPERYDVVIFRFPLDQSRMFIKRLIGLPGDTLEIRDGVLLINGATARSDFERDTMHRDIHMEQEYSRVDQLLKKNQADFERVLRQDYPSLYASFQGDTEAISRHLAGRKGELYGKYESERYNWGPFKIPGEGERLLLREISNLEYDYLVKYYQNIHHRVFYRIIASTESPVTLLGGEIIKSTRYFLDGKPLDPETFSLPEPLYFCLGDNRNNSHDSRDWGFMPRSLLDGEAMFLYYPFGRVKWIR